jgi:MFS family permease
MKKTLSGLRLILMLGFCGALAIFSSTISKSPILAIFARSLGATGSQIGWIASASTIPGILVSYIAGDLADRFGYKKILVGSLLIFATAPFFYLLVKNPLELGTVRFYHGFATAAFGPVAMATIAAFSGKHTGENLSLYSSATMIGRAIAPAVGGSLYDNGGYHSVYLMAGIAGILALIAAICFFLKPGAVEDKNATEKKKDEALKLTFFKKLRIMLSYPPLLFVGALDACVYFAYGAFEMIFPLYAKQFGMSTGGIGFLLGVQLVGIILFKPLFGRTSDKIGRLPTMITGLVVCAFSFFILSTSPSIYAIIPLILLYGLGFALITASSSALAADIAPMGQLGASLGILSTLMDVGQTLGPPTIGAISDTYNYSIGIGILGILFLLAAIGCIIALSKQPAKISK